MYDKIYFELLIFYDMRCVVIVFKIRFSTYMSYTAYLCSYCVKGFIAPVRNGSGFSFHSSTKIVSPV